MASEIESTYHMDLSFGRGRTSQASLQHSFPKGCEGAQEGGVSGAIQASAMNRGQSARAQPRESKAAPSSHAVASGSRAHKWMRRAFSDLHS